MPDPPEPDEEACISFLESKYPLGPQGGGDNLCAMGDELGEGVTATEESGGSKEGLDLGGMGGGGAEGALGPECVSWQPPVSRPGCVWELVVGVPKSTPSQGSPQTLKHRAHFDTG